MYIVFIMYVHITIQSKGCMEIKLHNHLQQFLHHDLIKIKCLYRNYLIKRRPQSSTAYESKNI